MAAFKPTFEVFRDLPLGSIQENSYFMAAPRGLEPRNPESESGVLPIRLKGNINEVALRSALFNRTYSLLLSTRRAYICSSITGVAGGERIELPPKESKSFELPLFEPPIGIYTKYKSQDII